MTAHGPNAWDTLRDGVLKSTGELNDAYLLLVDKIAKGHETSSRKDNYDKKIYDNLVSFASKFCGNHNQNSPFYDNLVWEFINYWGKVYAKKDTGYDYFVNYKDYRKYVEVFCKLREQQKLENFSLRHIELCIWKKCDPYNVNKI